MSNLMDIMEWENGIMKRMILSDQGRVSKSLNMIINMGIMANAVTLEVPSRVDVEVGPSWGEAA